MKRVSFLKLYMERANFLILDEPTSGLCRNSMYKTADFINAMRDDGKTVIVISHDYEFIKYCRGNIVEFKGRETKAL